MKRVVVIPNIGRQLPIPHLAKYIAIGAFGSLVDFVAYGGLLLVAVHPVTATMVGGIFGMVVNYFLNAKWNFRVQLNLRQAVFFCGVGLSGLMLGAFIVQMCLWWSVGAWAAKGVALAIVVPAQFLANRAWAFSPRNQA